MEQLAGLIVRHQSGFYWVETSQGRLVCQLRGRLKKGRIAGDIAAVGDRVTVGRLEGERGVIEAIEPRQRALVRMAPTPRGLYRQVLLANPDQVVFVFACTRPEPHLAMLDRFLVIAEKQAIPALVVANKVDLAGWKRAEELFGHYPPLGYPVMYTSAQTGEGLDLLREKLAGRLSSFSGPSGAGKSSLLNAIQPGLGLAVRDISRATRKGRHTTVVRELFRLEDGGYVADMPGLRSLALWDTQPEELDGYFPELRALVAECQFADCTHTHEPGCAVRKAVETGDINQNRYNSYLKLRYNQSNFSPNPNNIVDTRENSDV